MDIDKLTTILLRYKCSRNVLISESITIPDGIDLKGFILIPTNGIKGIVCTSIEFPFSTLDMDIEDIISAEYEIEKYRDKAHAKVFTSVGKNTHLKFSINDGNLEPEIIK